MKILDKIENVLDEACKTNTQNPQLSLTINPRQQSFPVHFSGLPSKLFVYAYTTLAFARPNIVTQLSSSHITQENFSFKPLGWKLETNLAACSVIAKSSFLNYTFTRRWTLLLVRRVQHAQRNLTAILGQSAIPHADTCTDDPWPELCSRAGAQYCMLARSSDDVDNCYRHELCGGRKFLKLITSAFF